MKDKIIKGLKMWLLYDLFLAVLLWATLGPEGIAELACESGVDNEVCEQFQ